MEVLRLSRQRDFSMPHLVRAISRDPALTAKLLKASNSVVYGVAHEITTVNQAVVWLGVQSVRTLALSFGLVRSRVQESEPSFDHKRYWKRSIISAVASRMLAKHVGSPWYEEAFLGALLQDIGMLAMKAALGAPYDRLYVEANGSHARLQDLEIDAFGGDHVDAAVWLSANWNLPRVLQESIRYSHASKRSELDISDREVRKVACAVATSGWIADIWVSDDTSKATRVAHGKAASLMRMDGQDLQDILSAVAESLPETSELFEMDVGSTGEVASILAEARDALVSLSLQSAQQAASAERTVEQLQKQTAQLEDEFQRDAMTGLYNRRRMEAALSGEFERAARLKSKLSVIFFDYDHFKEVNDTYGHQAGDAVLIEGSEIVQSEVRNSDIVARFGGEEFVVIMPGVDARGLRMIAERIRTRMQNNEFVLPSGEIIRCTISLGGATHNDTGVYAGPEDLLRAADQCVYAAKRSGRNRVVIEGDSKRPRDASS